MNYYTFNAITDYLQKYGKDYATLKVTRHEVRDFNSYEGYQWYINIKLEYPNGKYRLLKMHTNGSYMSDFEPSQYHEDESLEYSEIETIKNLEEYLACVAFD